jgi:hypothetical protein
MLVRTAFLLPYFVRIPVAERTDMERNSRRSFLKGAGATGIVTAACKRTPQDASRAPPYSFSLLQRQTTTRRLGARVRLPT